MCKLAIAVKALKKILDNEGKVCQEFEICKHVACQSSCSSWMIAHEALEEIGKKVNEDFIIKTVL